MPQYKPETCRDLWEWGYLQCIKALSKKSLIQIFDDIIANHELVKSVRETEKKNKQTAMSQISNCACAVLFFCYLSTTAAHLLLDDIEQAAAHFDPILCFQDTKNCWFFHIRKVWRNMKKKQTTLLEIFPQRCRLCIL